MARRFTKYPSNYVRASQMFFDENPIAVDGEWELYEPATFEAARQLAKLGGKKALWDTSHEKYYFDAYTAKGPLFIFVNTATGDKYQSHPATKSWMYDVYDNPASKEEFISFLDAHPKFADVFARAGYDYFTVSQDDYVDDGEFPGRFPGDFRNQ